MNSLEPTRDPHSTKTLDLIAAEDATALRLAEVFSRWLGRFSAAAIVALVALIALRLALAIFFHHQVAEVAGEVARVGGLDARVSAWMQGFAGWTAAIAMVGLGWRLLFSMLWPFGRSEAQMKAMLALLVLSGIGALLPTAIQTALNVDAQGRPAQLIEITDPAAVRWFGPDGGALIACSREPDGALRFWNRDGSTPDRSLAALPVTGEVRAEWERAEAVRLAAEQRRAEAEARAAAQAEAWAAARAEAEVRAAAEERRRVEGQRARKERERARTDSGNDTGPAPSSLFGAPNAARSGSQSSGALRTSASPSRWHSFQLRPGKWLYFGVEGRACQVRANGRMEIYRNRADTQHWILQAGETQHFPGAPGDGYTIHAQPLDRHADTLQVRMLE